MTRSAASARAAIAPFYVMEVMKAAGDRAAAGGDVLHLEVGQPSSPAPKRVVDASVDALRSDRLHYTDAAGTQALRARIAGWYADRYGIDVSPDRIVVTTGASGACVLAFLACFDAGERVAVARPSYPCYRNMLAAFGNPVVDLPIDASTRFQPTASMVERAVDQHGPIAGAVIASPSNPTGTMLPEHELRALADVCRRHDIWLIADEIYHGITYEAPAPTALAIDADAVIVQSFSKYFSMTGWRLGWLVVPEHLVTPVERLAQNLTVAPPSLAQLAGREAFDSIDELDGHVARYAANRRVLLDGLGRCGVRPECIAPADGAFYLWLDVTPWLGGRNREATDAEELCARWLDELAIAVTPGIDFDPVDGHRFVRFSYAGSTADVEEAMRRLETWVADEIR